MFYRYYYARMQDMPFRDPQLYVLDQMSLGELERELERRKRIMESNRRWLKQQLDRLAKQQEDVAALEAMVQLRKGTLH